MQALDLVQKGFPSTQTATSALGPVLQTLRAVPEGSVLLRSISAVEQSSLRIIRPPTLAGRTEAPAPFWQRRPTSGASTQPPNIPVVISCATVLGSQLPWNNDLEIEQNGLGPGRRSRAERAVTLVLLRFISVSPPAAMADIEKSTYAQQMGEKQGREEESLSNISRLAIQRPVVLSPEQRAIEAKLARKVSDLSCVSGL